MQTMAKSVVGTLPELGLSNVTYKLCNGSAFFTLKAC